MKETRFLEKKEVNVPIVNLRYWLRPGDQGPEPAWGGVSWGVSHRLLHLSVSGGRRCHIALQQRSSHEGAHRARRLCPAGGKPSLFSFAFSFRKSFCSVFGRQMYERLFSPSSRWWTLWTRSNRCLMQGGQGQWSGETARSSLDRAGSAGPRSPSMPWIILWLTYCSILPGIVFPFAPTETSPVCIGKGGCVYSSNVT